MQLVLPHRRPIFLPGGRLNLLPLPSVRMRLPLVTLMQRRGPARPDVSICLREPLLRGASLLQALSQSLKTPTFGDTDGQCPGTRGTAGNVHTTHKHRRE